MLEKVLNVFSKSAQIIFLAFVAMIIYSAIPHGWKEMSRLEMLVDGIPSDSSLEQTTNLLRTEGFEANITGVSGHEIVPGFRSESGFYAEPDEYVVIGTKPRVASTLFCGYDFFCAFIFDKNGKLRRRGKTHQRYCL